jgi:hypothetical protein
MLRNLYSGTSERLAPGPQTYDIPYLKQHRMLPIKLKKSALERLRNTPSCLLNPILNLFVSPRGLSGDKH